MVAESIGSEVAFPASMWVPFVNPFMRMILRAGTQHFFPPGWRGTTVHFGWSVLWGSFVRSDVPASIRADTLWSGTK